MIIKNDDNAILLMIISALLLFIGLYLVGYHGPNAKVKLMIVFTLLPGTFCLGYVTCHFLRK